MPEKKPFITLEQAQEIIADVPTPFHLYDEKGILSKYTCNGICRNHGNKVKLSCSFFCKCQYKQRTIYVI